MAECATVAAAVTVRVGAHMIVVSAVKLGSSSHKDLGSHVRTVPLLIA